MPLRTSLPLSSHAMIFSTQSISSLNAFIICGFCAARCPSFFILSAVPFMYSTSLMRSSLVMISMSPTGSTRSSTWITSGSSKARMTCMMPSTALMWLRNALPSPAPVDAPLTRPAMSTTSRKGCTTDLGLCMSTSQSKRSSGTCTRVALGSMVQNGKFSAGMQQFDSALYSVDFPTFGMPTMPTLRLEEKRPRAQGPITSSVAAFFGGIFGYLGWERRGWLG
mmetsp:Transcript_30035/g.74515  ORF Transcript_30035/g.74515 Transcript_30035/m.74515 type:complete len:223 (+) Transcript_30035:770-1438(+)